MARAQAGFRESLAAVDLKPGTMPVFANTTGSLYPDDAESDRELLAGQLSQPVEFVAQVEAMYRMEARTFLEVGPGDRLTGLVRSILDGREHQAIAVDASPSEGDGGNLAGLALALANLSALGYPVDLERWDDGYQVPASVPASTRKHLTVKICGAQPAQLVSATTFDHIPDRKPEGGLDDVANLPTITQRARTSTLAPKPRIATPTAEVWNSQGSRNVGENDLLERTMNPPEHDHHSGSDGRASSLASGSRPAVPDPARGARRCHSVRSIVEPCRPGPGDPPDPGEPGCLAAAGRADPQLHRQFLEGQAATQHTFQSLLEHQQRLTSAVLERGGRQEGSPQEPLPLAVMPSRIAPVSAPSRAPISDDLPSEAVNGSTSFPVPAPATPAPAVAEVLLQIVAEKTGYPVEMLELDMQLDDDLGIDSIKRVEILSALQDRLPEAPAVKPEHLGALRTLRQIADFLGQQPTDQEAASPRTGATVPAGRNGDLHRPAATCSASAPAVVVAEVLLQVVAEKTGYPVEMLELDMQLDDDLGIDSIKRVEILSALQDRLPEAPAVKPEHLGSLRTLRQIADFLGHAAGLAGAGNASRVRKRPGRARGGGRAPAHFHQGSGALAHCRCRGRALECLVPRAIPLAAPDRREAAAIAAGSEIWLVGDGSPLADAIRQRLIGRGHHVRLIEPEESNPPEPGEHVAGLIVLTPPTGQQMAFVKNAFRLVRTAGPSLRLHGARGGSALLTVSRMDGAFGLGGLADEIDPSSGALAGLLKTARQEWPEVHCKAVDLDAAYKTLESAAERIVEEMLRRGPAEVGLTESATNQVELVALPAAQPDRRQDPLLCAGEVVVISGGARGITAEVAVGVAASSRPRLVLLGRTPEPDAEPAWLAPLETDAAIRRAIRDHADQPCSPQVLSEQLRLIQSQREIRRNLQRIAAAGSNVTYHAIDVRNRDAVKDLLEGVCTRSGPVRGLIHGAGVLADRRIEDQTDAQFAHVFDTKVEGLLSLFDAIDPRQLQFLALFSSSTARYGRVGQAAYAAANEWLNKWAQRMARRLSACRVVAFNWGPWDGGMVTGALKPMFEREGLGLIAPADGARLLVNEIHSSGNCPVEVVVLASPRSHRSNGKMEPVFERRIDLGSLPVIRSHVIDGHAVLPMALILEWLAEGALHRHPGLVAQAVENLRLFKGVVLRDHRPSAVSIRVGKGQRRGESFIVPVEMRGVLESGREVTHARGEVIVADRHSPGERLVAEAELLPLAADREEIYRRVLFHGPAMQAIQQVEGCDDQTIAAWVSTSPPPASWMERPFRQTWLTDPLAIDAAFQLLVLWTRKRLGSSSLPTGVGAYRQFRKAFPAEGVRVLAAVRQHNGHRAVADIEFLDTQAHPVARIESYECVIDASLNQAFRRNRLSQLEIASS